ncbi:hypothetical protein JVT61DRAFT_2881 [Boletus reticuloceps]|uniref:Uncharacterized protein n=1 Tax=Boletus reticuloceps TaxID=495285 RepID=A0A8I2YSG1_9AGAM|nr:hypothetical protein JVT61DRAFT_2881 [Boletus reticuloceps]
MEQHNLYYCTTMEDKLGITWSEYKDWRKQLKYSKHHIKIFYMCHVPQISDDLHPTISKAKKGGRGTTGCEYVDVVAPITFAIYHDHELKKQAEQYFAARWPTLTEFAYWLMDVPKKNRHSNMIDLLS